MTPAIRAMGLGKRYELGRTLRRDRTLRESVVESVGELMRTIRRGGAQTDDRELWALRDASFEIAEGEAVGLIGANGAGKSTLLKLLSRVTTPTTGRAEIHGRVGSLLEVGTGFHPDLTGRENVFLNGAILGMRGWEIERKFDEIVAFAEVERFLDTPVKRYSSGMYLRLAFAVAAHLEPEVLLVDEVLAVGDAAFQRKCLGKMGDVAASGRTVVFVSHNMDAVMRLCTRALLLEDGRVAESGPSAVVVAGYLARGGTGAPPAQWIELADAPRRGSGEARFARVRYEIPDEPGRVPRPGGPVRFDIDIESPVAQTVASVAVVLRSQTGVMLLVADIIERGVPMTLAPGRNAIRFDIGALNLTSGTYGVTLWMSHAIGKPIDEVTAFDVEVLDDASRGLGASAGSMVHCPFTVSFPSGSDRAL
ncbi:MAG TPA: ABC transporter ATP-binding protein [Gemmatimonadaceae bacterium]|nr:ABC transporter ATP-binding protein [Gemmatimonadaceae bacterium]